MLLDKKTIFLTATLAFVLSSSMMKSASTQAPKTKQDVLGLTTGMAENDANKLINERGWKCQTFYQVIQELYIKYSCDTAAGFMFIQFAGFLENKPLISATLTLKTADTSDNIVASISEQYGRRARKIGKNEFYDLFEWSLNNSTSLKYNTFNRHLELHDLKLNQANDEAEQAAQRLAKPIPRF